jgi:RND superfamily putative drug exporter
VISRTSTFYEDGDGELVSRDRHATVIGVELLADPEATVEGLIDLVEHEDGVDGFEVAVTGEYAADDDAERLAFEGLRVGELYFGLPGALIVLLLVFGAVVAALVPVVLAIVAVFVAVGLTAIVGQFTDFSVYAMNMLAAMGLALGIDYSLFVVSRYREERAHGTAHEDAIVASGATASRAVAFSGGAFVIAMFGMLLVPDTTLRSLALAAILIGFVSVVAALTLLPALLGLLGSRVNALRVPLVGRSVDRAARGESRFWSGIANWVVRRPLTSLVAATALLLALALPVLDLNVGQPGIRTFPEDAPSRRGFAALERDFGVGTVNDVEIVVDGDVSSQAVRRGLERLQASLEREEAEILRRPTLDVYEAQRLAVLSLLVVGDSDDDRAVEAVERIRGDHVPAAFDGVEAEVLVTGESAENLDYRALVAHWLPIVLVVVLALSFLLLTLAFRSVVVPAKAILLNLLSVSAAYGLIVLVFQHGVGNELLGFRETEVVAPWIPLFLFSVLFGLSMDYHVFLLSRIRERYLQTGDTTEAVVFGVSSTSRLITGAALIIIVVWVGFSLGDLIELQQVGFGVAVALLIDATIVRSVLVPAAMELLGARNWYLPAWLDWLPELGERSRPAS